MTEHHSSLSGWWERCKADTLAKAKREAAMRYRGTYRDHEIRVGVGPDDLALGSVDLVSTRLVAHGSRWVDEDIVDGLLRSEAARSLGRIGGSRTSEAKSKASRANGRKGGRPRMTPSNRDDRDKTGNQRS
jgi:hypothetical protein